MTFNILVRGPVTLEGFPPFLAIARAAALWAWPGTTRVRAPEMHAATAFIAWCSHAGLLPPGHHRGGHLNPLRAVCASSEGIGPPRCVSPRPANSCMTVGGRRATHCTNQGLRVLDLALHRVGRGVGGGAAPDAVVMHHGKARNQQRRELEHGPKCRVAPRAIRKDERRATALLLVRHCGSVF